MKRPEQLEGLVDEEALQRAQEKRRKVEQCVSEKVSITKRMYDALDSCIKNIGKGSFVHLVSLAELLPEAINRCRDSCNRAFTTTDFFLRTPHLCGNSVSRSPCSFSFHRLACATVRHPWCRPCLAFTSRRKVGSCYPLPSAHATALLHVLRTTHKRRRDR